MKIQSLFRYLLSVIVYLALLWLAFHPETFSTHKERQANDETVLAESNVQKAIID